MDAEGFSAGPLSLPSFFLLLAVSSLRSRFLRRSLEELRWAYLGGLFSFSTDLCTRGRRSIALYGQLFLLIQHGLQFCFRPLNPYHSCDNFDVIVNYSFVPKQGSLGSIICADYLLQSGPQSVSEDSLP